MSCAPLKCASTNDVIANNDSQRLFGGFTYKSCETGLASSLIPHRVDGCLSDCFRTSS
jgi:hypothetical protein